MFEDVGEYRREPGDREAGDSLGMSNGARLSVDGRDRILNPAYARTGDDACVKTHGDMPGW